MLLSVSLHGGLAFYDWMTDSGDSRVSAAPVLVTLLPAIDMIPSSLTEDSPTLSDPQPSHKTPQAALPRSAQPSPKTTARKPVAAEQKSLPKKPLPVVAHDQAAAQARSSEMVCMIPKEVVSEQASGLPTELSMSEDQPGAAEQESTIVPEGPTESFASGSLSVAQNLSNAIPNYSSNPLPEYPAMARQKHWQGVVWLLVDVSVEGLVEDLRIEQSCGHRILDRAARRTVKRWRFTPARRAGLPVASQVRIPVRFRLEDS